jgi:hypothetical protein
MVRLEPSRIGVTSLRMVGTIASAGQRSAVLNHCLTAPYIAQLAVVAIIRLKMGRGRRLGYAA